MGWFSRTPELKVGDTVLDGYFASIGMPREKATIVKIVREGVFAREKYLIRKMNDFESEYPRKRSQLELIESAPKKPRAMEIRNQQSLMELQQRQIESQLRMFEAKRRAQREHDRIRAMKQEPQRSSWYDVTAKENMRYTNGTRSGMLEVKEGDLVRMRAVSDGTYELELEGEYVRLNKKDGYEVYNINDYATEYPRKKKVVYGAAPHFDIHRADIVDIEEEKDMGGELFGYPPEDDVMVPGTSLAKLEMQRTEEKRKAEEEIAELKRQLEEQSKKNEVARREKVAEEYGIVAERHLWSVTVDVPMQWSGPIPKRGCEETTEVLTEGRNMVEAAMAAEAMAKGISEEAHVLSIDYVRVIGAIKK